MRAQNQRQVSSVAHRVSGRRVHDSRRQPARRKYFDPRSAAHHGRKCGRRRRPRGRVFIARRTHVDNRQLRMHLGSNKEEKSVQRQGSLPSASAYQSVYFTRKFLILMAQIITLNHASHRNQPRFAARVLGAPNSRG